MFSPRAILRVGSPVKRALTSLSPSLWSAVHVHIYSYGRRLVTGSFGLKYCPLSSSILRYTTFSHDGCHVYPKFAQGHRVFSITRNYSTTTDEVKQQLEKPGKEKDTALPNESWTPESLALYDRLLQEIKVAGKDWKKIKSPATGGEVRMFLRNVTEPGKLFEYALFYSKDELKLRGFVQFGPYTQGPLGFVHGGAIASILDSAIGVLSNIAIGTCVTANLSVNYKSGIPLGTTAYGEGRIDRVEGRKLFASSEFKSPDGKITYATATALFILIGRDPAPDKDVANY